MEDKITLDNYHYSVRLATGRPSHACPICAAPLYATTAARTSGVCGGCAVLTRRNMTDSTVNLPERLRRAERYTHAGKPNG